MTAPSDVDALLAETRWLGGLARRLVGNGPDAEDLVQATLLAAVEQPPSPGGSLRAWLAAVLRNRSRDEHRRDAARSDRERATNDDATAPAADDVVAKAEAHRQLVAAVLALDEPYRTCVLLRFFENLPPRAIARRTATPVATVHSRLQRALALLRVRLGRSHGPCWQLALAPLLHRGDAALPFLFGASLVHTLGKVALGATVLVAASLVLTWPSTPAAPIVSPPHANDSAEVVTGDGATGGVASDRAAEREEATPEPASPPARATTERTVRGRVLDVHGAGVAGVALAFGREHGRPSVGAITSDTGGSFEAALPAGVTTVASNDTRWATVLAGSALVPADQRCTVVVAPRLELGGRVVDGGGAPLPGAAVSAHVPAQLGADLGVLLDFSTLRSWRAVCDDQGRFRLADVPSVAGASLTAELGGYEPRIADVPPASTELLELVLERPDRSASVITGLVVDRWGAGVAGARVGAGGAIARSDPRGAFTLDVTGRDADARLVALATGMQPAVFTPERGADGAPRWPPRIVLQLGPPPLTLAGRVVFADGRAVAGAKVWINDPTVVGDDGDAVLAEGELAGKGRPFWSPVVAADDGAFRIEGLCDRRYEVRAFDPNTLLQATVPGIAAGRDGVELRLPGDVFPRLRVRIATRDGQPVADAHVRLQRPALEVRVPGGTRDDWSNGQKGHTKADGTIEFTDVPTSGVHVFTAADAIMFAGKAIEPGIDPLAFELIVDRRLHLQVELAPPIDRADRLRVLDGDGQPMLLRIMRGNAAHASRSAVIADGRSHILSLGEGARTVVFLRNDAEVGRLPVQLTAGQVTTVRF